LGFKSTYNKSLKLKQKQQTNGKTGKNKQKPPKPSIIDFLKMALCLATPNSMMFEIVAHAFPPFTICTGMQHKSAQARNILIFHILLLHINKLTKRKKNIVTVIEQLNGCHSDVQWMPETYADRCQKAL
jgi:hypothetical protein